MALDGLDGSYRDREIQTGDKMKKTILLIVLAALTLSCEFGLEPDVSNGQEIEYYTATPLFFESGASISASAAVPFWEEENLLIEDGYLEGYPVPGQNTNWSVTEVVHVSSGLYRIYATTLYSTTDLIVDTEEVYYIQDANNNGVWDDGDFYADEQGNADTLYREKYVTHFSNGDVRTEEIVSDSTQEGFSLPSDIYEEHEFASKVEYTQGSSVVDATKTQISGTRWYINTGVYEKTYIYEEGMLVNPRIEGAPRGRSEIYGEIVVINDPNVGLSVTGFYEVTSKDQTWSFRVE